MVGAARYGLRPWLTGPTRSTARPWWPRSRGSSRYADAEIAVGHEPHVDAATAADGIEELLENLPSFGWVAERVRELGRDGETLHLHATDGDGEWMIRPGDGGFTWERGHGKGTAAVRAATGDLLLLVYGRLRPDDERLEVFGDRDLLSAWLTATAL
ncbi:hypothetical protein GCM10023195_21500 [Actinoallomurus liliacearum]|uniref:MDMPI C-terminal domain-containing protein n=1 Tax=Actinoallomurus liliacearum TaxID=1080073 RepID=A0ABP8TEC0_9ACTN